MSPRPESVLPGRWPLVAANVAAIAMVPSAHLALRAIGWSAVEFLLSPAIGIAIACFVVLGRAVWPGVLVGAFVEEMFVGVAWKDSAYIAVIHTVEAAVVAWLLLRVFRFRRGFLRQRDAVVFMACGVVIAPVLGGLLWGLMYGVVNGNWGFFLPTWHLVAYSHAVGVMAFGAFLLALVRLPRGEWLPWPRVAEGVVIVLACVVVASSGWIDPWALGDDTVALAFLPIAFVVWAGLRIGPMCASGLSLCVVVIAAWGTESGLGPFAREAQHGSGGLMLVFAALAVFCALFSSSMILERRRAEVERERLAQRVSLAERREGLGMLAGGIAHDFNNLLTPLLAGTELLDDEVRTAEGKATLQHMARACEQARGLCQQMLAYAGRGSLEREVVDVSATVEDMADLVRLVAGKDVPVEFGSSESAPPIEIDTTQLRQVVLNLVKNSAEAMRGRRGVVRVSTRECVANQEFLDQLVGGGDLTRPGTYVGLQVEDTGCGISADYVRQVFDPFFSTKQHGRGLGLASVLGVAEAAGGGIQLHSVEGEGTTVTAWFPATTLPKTEAARDVPARPRPRAATVLVVDDEASVRHASRLLLEREGHTVLEAESGEVAVELFRERSDDIDLVLLDLTMPGIDGHETRARLDQIRSGVPTILCSGYDARGSLDSAAFFAVLQKPFDGATLLSKVHAAVGKPSRVDS